ncbi:hypothetical protein [Propionimicrobium sp. PCR01-08-3]|nr:hypothetical protein [Propionimicrobium sp. PCR01-08-3]WIY82020.1 hypothetical protein QQ658_10915 [Propionimicrobium sp. PCR01-08-3]
MTSKWWKNRWRTGAFRCHRAGIGFVPSVEQAQQWLLDMHSFHA